MAVQAGVSDLVGNLDCWLSHAAAHFSYTNILIESINCTEQSKIDKANNFICLIFQDGSAVI